MNFTHFAPCAPLRPYVAGFLLVETEAGGCNQVLPDTALVLALRLSGQVSSAHRGELTEVPAALTGLSSTVRHLTYAPRTATLLVRFTPLGAAAFFPPTLHELRDQSVALADVLGPALARQLGEGMAEAFAHPPPIALVERFLLRQLRPAPVPEPVRQVVQQIQASGGEVRIGRLLAAQPISRDPFEKAFRRVVGTSPKQFAAIVRLREVLRYQRLHPTVTELAHATGYFDQAHFTHDFKAFTGQAPAAFFARGAY